MIPSEGGSIAFRKSKILGEEIDFLRNTTGKKGIMATSNHITAIENNKKTASRRICVAFKVYQALSKSMPYNLEFITHLSLKRVFCEYAIRKIT
jgi:hypothetical protein